MKWRYTRQYGLIDSGHVLGATPDESMPPGAMHPYPLGAYPWVAVELASRRGGFMGP